MNIIETNFKWNGSLNYNNKPKKIVLHHAEAKKCTVEDIHRWHLGNGWTGIGYHFFVRKDGSIYRGRPENVVGAHVSGANTNTLGICAEGSYMTETMPLEQLNAIKWLIGYLDNKYGQLPIYGHREIGSSNCPGVNYPLEEIKARNGIQNIVTSTPSPQPVPQIDFVYEKAKSYNKARCLELQQKLNKVGSYGLAEDNIYGQATHKALGDFQGKNSLTVDYLAGNATFSKLDQLIAKKNSSIGNDWIRRLQKELNVQKFRDKNGNVLAEDGILGEMTVSAFPVIKYGSKGNITKLVQELLNSKGYNTNGIDGLFYNGSVSATKQYQKDRKVSIDGAFGKECLRVYNK